MVHLRGGSSGYSPSLFTIWCRILFFYHHSWCSIFWAERRNTLLRHYFQLVTFCVQCPTHCLTYSLTSAVILMQGTQYYILPSLVQFSYSLLPNTLLSVFGYLYQIHCCRRQWKVDRGHINLFCSWLQDNDSSDKALMMLLIMMRIVRIIRRIMMMIMSVCLFCPVTSLTKPPVTKQCKSSTPAFTLLLLKKTATYKTCLLHTFISQDFHAPPPDLS